MRKTAVMMTMIQSLRGSNLMGLENCGAPSLTPLMVLSLLKPREVTVGTSTETKKFTLPLSEL
jgi:hypothetical protein